jgi:hypothetical protein
MSDPALTIQGKVVEALKASSSISSLIAGRVYDSVPQNSEFPYVTVGQVQVLPDRAQDYDGADVVFTIDGWSRAPGFPEVKRIGMAVHSALVDADLALDDFRLIELIPEQTQYLRDPDGLTSHGVFVFRARTEPST